MARGKRVVQDRLRDVEREDCSRCGAKAGEKCVNYKGHPKQTCYLPTTTDAHGNPLLEQRELFGGEGGER